MADIPAMYGQIGDQCADTDGLAAERDALLAEIAALKAERATCVVTVKIDAAEVERMVREAAERLGIPLPAQATRTFPPRALRFGAQDIGLRCGPSQG